MLWFRVIINQSIHAVDDADMGGETHGKTRRWKAWSAVNESMEYDYESE